MQFQRRVGLDTLRSSLDSEKVTMTVHMYRNMIKAYTCINFCLQLTVVICTCMLSYTCSFGQ